MTARAGIVVTGTEVLAGIIPDRNGPWLSERLRERGVQLAHIMIVADRREDLRAALDFLAREGMDLIITSGGLGPTADDLTAEVVGEFAGREMVLDPALEKRIWVILQRLRSRWRNLDEDAVRAGNRKQAVVPEGATILEPVGTAPGLVVPPADGSRPTVLVLPGPPGELQPMWEAAAGTEALRAALAGAGSYEQRILRLYGIPESEIAGTLRAIEADGVPLDRLEITTCLRRGEIEIATVFEPDAAPVYADFEDAVRARHADTLFSEDGSTVDEQVARLLEGMTVAVAESCTGGLMTARLTDRPGSSAYVRGGAVVYADEAKSALAGVPGELIARVGAVSAEVAAALADGAAERFGADIGIGITGVAGPGGGSEEKPVGTVHLSVARRGGGRLDRRVLLPGDRAAIRERTTTATMHLLRRLLEGESDDGRPGGGGAAEVPAGDAGGTAAAAVPDSSAASSEADPPRM
jgi:nicotinamide-nucleotide amidase